MADGERPAPQRRDARRNREALAAAAADVFAELGLDAPLDVIARRAGVGNATLYRHFPTREDLIGEVFRPAAAVLAEAARKPSRPRTPGRPSKATSPGSSNSSPPAAASTTW
ncbi:helix-turn-helix domain-containing protein [Kitasatospora arboriphila]